MFGFFWKNTSSDSTLTMSATIQLVNEIVKLENSDNKALLQSKLTAFDAYLTGNGANKIISEYPQKENLSLCYSFLIHYIGGTLTKKTEWAEKSYYCMVEYLDHQKNGRQGQAEGCLLLFVMLCVGRDYLKPRLQNIMDSSIIMNSRTLEPLFDVVDNMTDAQNVIDQFSLFATSGIRDLGKKAIPVIYKILNRYNGLSYFVQTINRTDLLRYDPSTIIDKMRFLRDEIAKSLLK